MQSFFTCTNINDKDSKDQNANDVKCLIFLYFQYNKMKIQGLNNNFI
jgi:hypothetical protein